MPFPPADQVPLGERYELTTHLIALEVIRRGHTPRWLRNALFVVDVDGVAYGWNMSRCTITSTIGAELTMRKDYTRTLLSGRGLAVAPGGAFRPTAYEAALERAESVGWPVVVKPAGQGSGRGVTVGVRSRDEFREAWEQASSPNGRILVEAQVTGSEARFLTVAGRCVAVAGRIPAHVTGDGRSSVGELVDAKNTARQESPHLRRHRVPLRGDPGRVPAEGERVTLDDRGGFSSGAESVDLTDVAHPSYLEIAGRAETAFPQLGISGVDIIADDFTQPATPDNHIVVEVNARPAIGAHHFPWIGESRDVAAAIVDACLR